MKSNLEYSYNGMLSSHEKEMSYKATVRYERILDAYFFVKENHAEKATYYMTMTIPHFGEEKTMTAVRKPVVSREKGEEWRKHRGF